MFQIQMTNEETGEMLLIQNCEILSLIDMPKRKYDKLSHDSLFKGTESSRATSSTGLLNMACY